MEQSDDNKPKPKMDASLKGLLITLTVMGILIALELLNSREET